MVGSGESQLKALDEGPKRGFASTSRSTIGLWAAGESAAVCNVTQRFKLGAGDTDAKSQSFDHTQSISKERYRLLMLLGSFVNPAAASERPDNGLSLEERDPNHWIEKMGTALIEENYRGVFTIARGREFNSIEIDHRYQDGVVTEHLTQQNGLTGRSSVMGSPLSAFMRIALLLDHAVHLGPFSQSFNASCKRNQITTYRRSLV